MVVARIISSLIAVGFLVSVASARCMVPGTPAQELKRADAVFSAEVVGSKYVDDANEYGFRGKRLVIELKVDRVWKGDVKESQDMFTAEMQMPNGATWMMAEDFRFENGAKYLVYGFGPLDKLTTSACSRSRPIEKAGEDLKELGEGKTHLSETTSYFDVSSIYDHFVFAKS